MGASFRLSNEELALVCSLLGKPGFAYSALGVSDRSINIVDDETQHARLLTAGHGLMARYAMSVEVDGTISLSETLANIGQIITDSDYVLEFSRADEIGAWQTFFHFYRGQIWEHFTEAGVVHEIRQVEELNEVFSFAVEFFHFPETIEVEEPWIWHIPLDLESLQNMLQASSVEQTIQGFEKGGLPSEAAQMLAPDIHKAVMRGGVLRNQYDDGLIISSQGCVLIQGPSHYWLLEVPAQSGSTGEVIIQPFSRPKFEQLMIQWTSNELDV